MATPRPAFSSSPPRIIVIGAGSRGRAYARAVATCTNGIVVAVAEPDAFKREAFGRQFVAGWDEQTGPPAGAAFAGWSEFVQWEQARRRRETNGANGHANGNGNGAAGSNGTNGNGTTEAFGGGVDAAFVCVQDEAHLPCVRDLAPLGLHVLCEKPLATRLEDCVELYGIARRLQNSPQRDTPAWGGRADVVEGKEDEEEEGAKAGGGAVFGVGHVLRYSPHNMTLRRLLLEERVVGDVLSVVHTEPVGWWHFAHSYVRGNWRREDTSAPSLLTKSCHDLDLLLWLMCEQPPARQVAGEHADVEAATRPHLPSTVTATGSRQFFRRARKPLAAGAATNCLSCPAEPDCAFSAKKIYVTGAPSGFDAGNTGWPVSIVLPEIEDLCRTEDEGGGKRGASAKGRANAKARLLERLAEDYDRGKQTDEEIKARNWFGRCVFEADNDVCDEEVVTMTWEDDVIPPSSSSSSTTSTTTPSQPPPTAAGPDALFHRGAKTATFHMVSHTRQICERQTHVYGTRGELTADSRTITLHPFASTLAGQPAPEPQTFRPYIDPTSGHGGGDGGLARQFVLAVDRVKNHGWAGPRAQRDLVGCTLDEMLRSHALVFAAEQARTEGRQLDWQEWWAREVEAKLK